MSLAILFHFLCAQHVSDINISIIRSLRQFCWITTLVVLFSVRCVLDFRCGLVGVVSVLQTSAYNTDTTSTQPHRISNTHRTKNNMTNVVIQQNSRKLLTESCKTDTTPTQPHRIPNTHRTKNNTTNVVIQQNKRKLLMMDILISETCWAHKKWDKIASDIKLVFYSSTITMMHGPINIGTVSSSCSNYKLFKKDPTPWRYSKHKTRDTLNKIQNSALKMGNKQCDPPHSNRNEPTQQQFLIKNSLMKLLRINIHNDGWVLLSFGAESFVFQFSIKKKIKIYRIIILPSVLYECVTWSLTLWEKRWLRVFEKRVLRRIFGTKRDEVTGEWIKLNIERFNDLFSSPNIARLIKPRRMR